MKQTKTFSVGGTLYTLVLFKIIDKDSFGRPRNIEMMADSDVIDVTKPENRNFMTAFVQSHMCNPASKGLA